MSRLISSWAHHADFEYIKNIQIRNRDVYIWGGFAQGKQLRGVLSKHGIEAKGYIDSFRTETKYDGLPMSSFGDCYSPESAFIFVGINGRKNAIVSSLQARGFCLNDDYIYPSELIPHVVISQCCGEYCDQYGNRIVVNEDGFSADIEIIGYGNQITVGAGAHCGSACRLIAEHGAKIILGDDESFGDNVLIEAREGGSVFLCNACSLCDDVRICSYGDKIQLGKKCSFGRRALILCGVNSYAVIGEDCMFASDTSVLASDTHTIVDIESQEVLSVREVGVEIGNHVWAGKNAVILYNSVIGDGCIIGANSLVKTQAGSNCVVAGNPAKVVSKNRAWDRRRNIQFEDL